MTRIRMPLALLTAMSLVLLASLSGCGSDSDGSSPAAADAPPVTWLGEDRPIPGLRQRTIGSGAGTVVLLWSKGKPRPRDAVVFLHGFLLVPPSGYGKLLRHLADGGNTVIYPAYGELGAKPESYLAGAVEGIGTGLRAAGADPHSVVAVGHVTGGALAFDYAAVAADNGLPIPRGALAIFPGRNPPTGEVTPADLSRIPPGTSLVAIAGPGDPLPNGEAEARALLRGASQVPVSQRRYVAAPPPPSLAIRPSSWKEIDRLIAVARQPGG